MRHLFIMLVLTLAAVAAAGASATTRYVSDQLQITLRSGQSTQHKILRVLESGARLRVLETNPDSGYSKVRVPDGPTGWVITRYLMDEPAARQQLPQVKQRADALETQNAELKEKVEALTEANQALEARRDRLDEQRQRLKQELAEIRRTSGRAIEIADQNKKLKEQVIALQHRVDTLESLNTQLRDQHQQGWFLAGAGVLLGGFLLGMVAPRLRKQRQQGWDRV